MKRLTAPWLPWRQVRQTLSRSPALMTTGSRHPRAQRWWRRRAAAQPTAARHHDGGGPTSGQVAAVRGELRAVLARRPLWRSLLQVEGPAVNRSCCRHFVLVRSCWYIRTGLHVHTTVVTLRRVENRL